MVVEWDWYNKFKYYQDKISTNSLRSNTRGLITINGYCGLFKRQKLRKNTRIIKNTRICCLYEIDRLKQITKL